MADQTPEGIKMIFTEEFYNILKKLEAENNYLAFELLWMIEPGSKFHNGLKISKVDVSKQDWSFAVGALKKGESLPTTALNMKVGLFGSKIFSSR